MLCYAMLCSSKKERNRYRERVSMSSIPKHEKSRGRYLGQKKKLETALKAEASKMYACCFGCGSERARRCTERQHSPAVIEQKVTRACASWPSSSEIQVRWNRNYYFVEYHMNSRRGATHNSARETNIAGRSKRATTLGGVTFRSYDGFYPMIYSAVHKAGVLISSIIVPRKRLVMY